MTEELTDEKLAADPKLTYEALPIGARQIRDHGRLVQVRNEVNALRSLVLALTTQHSHNPQTGEAMVPASVLVQAAAAAPRGAE